MVECSTVVITLSVSAFGKANKACAILILLDRGSGWHSLCLLCRNSLPKNHFFNETSELVQSCLVGIADCPPHFFSLPAIP